MQHVLTVALLLVLSEPTHEVRADASLMLPSPTFDIPFDDQPEATTQVMVAQEVLTFLLTAQS